MANTATKSLGRSYFSLFRLFHTRFSLLRSEVWLVIICGIYSYYTLSLLSFNASDSGFFSVSFPTPTTVNSGGFIGAFLGSVSLMALGISSFIFPLPYLFFCIMQTTQKKRNPFNLFVCYVILTTILLWVSIYIPTLSYKNINFPFCGILGSSSLNILKKILGLLGLQVVFFSILAAITTQYWQPLRMLMTSLFSYLFAKVNKAYPLKGIQPTNTYGSIEVAVPATSTSLHNSQTGIEELTPISKDPIVEIVSQPLKIVEAQTPQEIHNPEKGVYLPPNIDVFKKASSKFQITAAQQREYQSTAELLTKTFADFGITGQVSDIHPGPVVTVFEFEPDAGTKLSKIVSLVDDLALALKVDSIFVYPVRGKRAVGVQVPNQLREMVYLGDIIASDAFKNSPSPLTFAMGKDLSGEPVCADLTSMPHLLTAGATGSGKSVAINTLLSSIIMKSSPDEVRMILVDPKMLELSVYDGIPHLLMPVITEPGRASLALKWATQEMERRYKIMQSASVRNILGFNQWWSKATSKQRFELMEQCGEKNLQTLPYILLVIDELADLMMMAPKDVEQSIQRLAQKARASGIHLVLATQRPSVDIITGVIKANLPCRVAFQVVSKHDSRTILDQVGAEKLLGKGDMLFMRPGASRIDRIQGAFVSDEEVLNLVASAKERSAPEYDETVISWIEEELARQSTHEDLMSTSDTNGNDDPKWDEALQIARGQGFISASFLQRQLKIGYNRAARIVDCMESQSLISKADGSKPRKWIAQ